MDEVTIYVTEVIEEVTVSIQEGAGSIDHGELEGLSGDDHTQYHNNERGDARYYTQSGVDSQMAGKANVDHSHVGQIFPIWAEENSSLSAGAVEWAFGNGADSPDDQGICLPFDCELFAVSAVLKQGSATIGTYQNGSKVHDLVVSAGANPRRVYEQLDNPVQFLAGESVSFRTTAASGTDRPNTICAWFRKTTSQSPPPPP